MHEKHVGPIVFYQSINVKLAKRKKEIKIKWLHYVKQSERESECNLYVDVKRERIAP